MARKSKAFKELYQARKQPKRKRKTGSNRLLETAAKELGLALKRLVSSPPGQEKMSDILENFAEPYLPRPEEDGDLEKFEYVFDLAVIAWNSTIISPSNPLEIQEKLFEQADNPEWELETREVLRSMVERKQEHFPECRRMILNYTLEDRGYDYYLSVMSSSELKPDDKASEDTETDPQE